jgi:hypothetical protein
VTHAEILRSANNAIVPVLDLGNFKLWRRRNQPTDQRLSLHPRQVHADALMHAMTEAEMGFPFTVDIEALGIAENRGIVVGDARQEVDCAFRAMTDSDSGAMADSVPGA